MRQEDCFLNIDKNVLHLANNLRQKGNICDHNTGRVAWHEDEQYHLLELEPLIAVIKHIYYKGKCNILVERSDEVLQQVNFFRESIYIYN